MAQGKRGFIGWIWSVLWRVSLALLLLTLLLLLLLRFVAPPTSAFMLQSPHPVSQRWVDIDTLPQHVALAVVASEDQRFPAHFGVDMTEIKKALQQFDDGDGLRGETGEGFGEECGPIVSRHAEGDEWRGNHRGPASAVRTAEKTSATVSRRTQRFV